MSPSTYGVSPASPPERAVALEIDGHLRLLSAAEHWGWKVKWPASFPQIQVAAKPAEPVDAWLTVAALPPHAFDGWATSRVQTVLDCASELPFDEALAVTDSALRSGDVTHEQLETALTADTSDVVRRVVGHATALEANSWAHHATNADHDADCARYNALVVGGWIVLRFTWEQVMFTPHVAVDTVRAAMTLPVAA